MSKGGKRKGSGRKKIFGKDVKIKLPNETINIIQQQFIGKTLAEKVKKSINYSIDSINNNEKKIKKYKVLDLFSGAGGLSLGFKLASFDIIGAVDFDSSAIETHSKNFNTKFVYCGDIRKIKNSEIESIGDVDVIIGGPPCQGFSSANRNFREKDDIRNKLFFEFIKFIKILKPKIFLMENVKEVLTKDNGFVKKKIIDITTKNGYNVSVKVLDSVNYGVPQKRKRAFFVGILKSFNVFFDFEKIPKSKKIFTVYDAIGDIAFPKKKIKNNFLTYAKNEKKIENHNPIRHSSIVVERIKHVPQGGNWKNVPKELWNKERNNRHSSSYKRLSFDLPSVTIDTGHMNYFHPYFNRTPTVRESARLQSFPDSFIFFGNKSEQYRQVGNAVPPLLSKAIAMELKKILDGLKNEKK